MKSLLVTTGKKNYIMNKYLPSLINKGCYNGDILLVNYIDLPNPLTSKDVTFIKNKYKVMVKDVKKVYSCIASDRIRAFYECLKEDEIYKNYDSIMVTDGDDIEYFNSIIPLFKISKSRFSCCIETPEHLVKGWIRFKEYPDADKVWEVIQDKPMINAGVLVGPSKEIFKVLEFITEQTKYNSKFGADQMLLNALVYYYKFPTQLLGYEWNYVIYTSHRRNVAPNKEGKVFAIEDGKEINIFHRNGKCHMDATMWRKLVFPACKMPNEGKVNKIVNKRIIEDVRESISGRKDWGGAAQTDSELNLMSYLLNRTKDIEGDIAEVGVYKGGSAKFMCNFRNGKTMHLFDTFEGLPETDEDDYIEKYGRHKDRRVLAKGEMAVSIDYVKNVLKDQDNIFYYKGLFPDTSKPI
jgi:hypothetical protein